MSTLQVATPSARRTRTGLWALVAGCALGNIAGEILAAVLAVPTSSELLLDALLAAICGVLFAGFARRSGIYNVLSILAFEMGFVLWMGLARTVVFAAALPRSQPAFWLIFQAGTVIGLGAALLVRRALARTT